MQGLNSFPKYSFPIFLMVLTGALLVVASTATFAQSKKSLGLYNEVRVGSTVLNVGVGMGADYGNAYHNFALGGKAAAEFGLWQAGPGVFTMGGEFGGSFSNRGHENDYKSHLLIVAARAAWHCGWNVPRLDTYGGWSVGMGFRHKESISHYSNNDIVPAIGSFLGASYFISPNSGFNIEMGYDITNIQAGIIFRLR